MWEVYENVLGFSWAVLLSAVVLMAPVHADSDVQSDQDTSETARKLVYRAREFLEQKNDAEAERCYRQAVTLYPDSALAHLRYGEALYHWRKYEEALSECRQAIKLSPQYGEAYTWMGYAYFKLERHREAVSAFEQGELLGYEDDVAHLWLGYSYARTGNRDKANELFESLAKISEGDEKLDVLDEAGNAFYNAKDAATAVTWWRRAADLGHKPSAKMLYWAYSVGYGTEESMTQSLHYWSVGRTADDWFPWSPFQAWLHRNWIWIVIALAVVRVATFSRST